MKAERLDCFPSYQSLKPERPPRPLPLLDTQEIIEHMPDDTWQLPEPYAFPYEFGTDDDQDRKQAKREGFHRLCQEQIISQWIPFLDRSQKGLEVVDKFKNQGVLSADLRSIQSFISFSEVAKPRMKQEDIGTQQMIESVRDAFLYLLTDQQAEDLGHQRPKDVKPQDIKRTKYLVNNLVSHLIYE